MIEKRWKNESQNITKCDIFQAFEMRKMIAGESQPSNGLAFPQITRSAGIFWLSELTSKSEG